jgi:hypothetical protein
MKKIFGFVFALSSFNLFALNNTCDWVQDCASQSGSTLTTGGYTGGASYQFTLAHDSTDIALYETLHRYQCIYNYKMQDPHPSNESCLGVLDSLTPEQWVCSRGLASATQWVTKFNFGIGGNEFTGTPQGNRRDIRFVHEFNLPDNVENCEETATGVKCQIIGCMDELPQDQVIGLRAGDGGAPQKAALLKKNK